MYRELLRGEPKPPPIDGVKIVLSAKEADYLLDLLRDRDVVRALKSSMWYSAAPFEAFVNLLDVSN